MSAGVKHTEGNLYYANLIPTCQPLHLLLFKYSETIVSAQYCSILYPVFLYQLIVNLSYKFFNSRRLCDVNCWEYSKCKFITKAQPYLPPAKYLTNPSAPLWGFCWLCKSQEVDGPLCLFFSKTFHKPADTPYRFCVNYSGLFTGQKDLSWLHKGTSHPEKNLLLEKQDCWIHCCTAWKCTISWNTMW